MIAKTKGIEQTAPAVSITGNPPKSLRAFVLRNAGQIRALDDERGTEDGYWIYLRPGWCESPQAHIIHEYTVADMIESFQKVRSCDCEQCKAAQA